MFTVTHPGKIGDLLWALPTVRAIAETLREPVRLWLPDNVWNLRGLEPILTQQDYIDSVVYDLDWKLTASSPEGPQVPPALELWSDASVYHAGLAEWPRRPLPFEYAWHADNAFSFDPADPLDSYAQSLPAAYFRPWITPATRAAYYPLLFAWTDHWVELKLGLMAMAVESLPPRWMWKQASIVLRDSRVHREGGWVSSPKLLCDLSTAATTIASCDLLVTDCSALHVLAAAMGKRCLVMEPEPARHNSVFWPGCVGGDARNRESWAQADNVLGKLIFPVLGGDGLPTFDARCTADAIVERLARIEQGGVA